MSEPDLDGVLRIDKPTGPTSHDVVARVRRVLRTRRIGHTGTLDPFASGLLLLCVGRATRIAEYLSGLDKQYTATLRLGTATDTDDLTGTTIATADPASITRADVERALDPLRGSVLQTPPAYSAKKRGGERAYAAARAGRALELEPVHVTITRLEIIDCALPDVQLLVGCSSGTYIRAIARDVGAALGVGAHLTALRRTAVGSHTLAGAVSLDDLHDADVVRSALLPALEALEHLPRQDVDATAEADIRHGRAVRVADGGPDADIVTIAAAGRLLGIGRRQDGWLRPRKVLL